MELIISKDRMMKTLTTLIAAGIFSCLSLNLHADTSNEVTSIEEPIEAVYINQANEETLATLKGVGQKRAHAIVLFRTENGKFESIEDLLKVKGIGEKVLSDNANRIKI